MRTFFMIFLGLILGGTAISQPSTATQTIAISVQTPTRIWAASTQLAMELRSEGRSVVGSAIDRIGVRTRPGRKVSACLKEAIPSSSKLTVRFGNDIIGTGERIALNGADRAVDLTRGPLPSARSELDVEYRWTSDAGSASFASETQTIVYTLTD